MNIKKAIRRIRLYNGRVTRCADTENFKVIFGTWSDWAEYSPQELCRLGRELRGRYKDSAKRNVKEFTNRKDRSAVRNKIQSGRADELAQNGKNREKIADIWAWD